MSNRVVFLDRDGTINREVNYLYKVEDFEYEAGAVKGLKMLQEAGFGLIVITNQSGIARGMYTEEDYRRLMSWMEGDLLKQGIRLLGTYYCPHHPDAVIEKYRKRCRCRKPEKGLFEQAIAEHDVDIRHSYAIGDRLRDCSICSRENIQGFLIGQSEDKAVISDVMADRYPGIRYRASLLDACREIVGNCR